MLKRHSMICITESVRSVPRLWAKHIMMFCQNIKRAMTVHIWMKRKPTNRSRRLSLRRFIRILHRIRLTNSVHTSLRIQLKREAATRLQGPLLKTTERLSITTILQEVRATQFHRKAMLALRKSDLL